MTDYMQIAIELAKRAAQQGEVPVGALVTFEGNIIAQSGNTTYNQNDPTGHAEIDVLRKAAQKLGTPRLNDCDLWVTLEPCTMCAGAISHARIKRLYFGARDTKAGAVESGVRFFNSDTCLHRPEVYSGICETQCGALLSEFFASRRDQ